MIDENNFQTIFFCSEHGREIRKCIQCGTCSASCPLADVMDYGPRSLFALIRDGQMAPVLNSNTPWTCVSCYQCTNRCPKEIAVTELMYTLKRIISQSKEKTQANRARDLHLAFSASLNQFGRVTETFIMAIYALKHPLAAVYSMPLATQMAKRKRVDLKPQQVQNPAAMRRTFKRVKGVK